MACENVHSLLITTKNNSLSDPFLFQVLRHCTINGKRVLYIAPKPISTLPPTIQDNEVLSDPEMMRLISFHYLPGKNELLTYLSTINMTHKPPSTIIIQNMEMYCESSSAGLVCAMAVNAASICSSRLENSCNLVVSFKMPVPPIVVSNFFHNVWCIHQDEDNAVVVRNINPKVSQPAIFHFSIAEDFSRFIITKVFERL